MPTWITVAAVIAIVVIGIIVVVQLIVIAALFFIIKNLMEGIRERIDPLVSKVNSLLVTVGETAQNVQGRTEHIAERAAQTSDVLAGRVEKISGFMQGVLTAPIIVGSAFTTGIARGVYAWRRAKKQRASGQSPTRPETPSSSAPAEE